MTTAPVTPTSTPTPMTARVADLVAKARAEVEDLTPEQVAAELAAGAVVVDLRDAPELAAGGMIEGAVHVPRGMLEFRADPTGPYHQPELDPTRRTVLYCASGGRSALAARSLAQLGYTDLAHMGGGFAAWTEAALPTTHP